MERHDTLMKFIEPVNLFKGLNKDRLSKIADCLDQVISVGMCQSLVAMEVKCSHSLIQDYYAEGHYIIREGEKGDTFFIINSGEVRVTQMIEGSDKPQEIRLLKKGDFFGEKALLG